MQNATTSTIAQLLFSRPPMLNFARLVADLDECLSQCPCDDRRLTWDHDDVAIFDVEGSRITVSYNDDLKGVYACCLNLSVGYSETSDIDSPIARRQGAVARMMADRISDRFPPDAIQWLESSDVVTSDILDGLVDLLPTKRPAPEPEPRMTSGSRMAPVDIDRIMQELEGRLETKVPKKAAVNHSRFPGFSGIGRSRMGRHAEAQEQVVEKFVVSNDVPEVPQPLLTEAQIIRNALYTSKKKNQEHSTELRLATHAMNATLMVIALPVGASMMTYSILRGENLHASARVLAIMGMIAGLEFTPIGARVLSFI